MIKLTEIPDFSDEEKKIRWDEMWEIKDQERYEDRDSYEDDWEE